MYRKFESQSVNLLRFCLWSELHCSPTFLFVPTCRITPSSNFHNSEFRRIITIVHEFCIALIRISPLEKIQISENAFFWKTTILFSFLIKFATFSQFCKVSLCFIKTLSFYTHFFFNKKVFSYVFKKPFYFCTLRQSCLDLISKTKHKTTFKTFRTHNLITLKKLTSSNSFWTFEIHHRPWKIRFHP